MNISRFISKHNPAIFQGIEQLSYRVTVGDLTTYTGLDIKATERSLLALASEARGHLQVLENGEIVYFPLILEAF